MKKNDYTKPALEEADFGRFEPGASPNQDENEDQ